MVPNNPAPTRAMPITFCLSKPGGHLHCWLSARDPTLGQGTPLSAAKLARQVLGAIAEFDKAMTRSLPRTPTWGTSSSLKERSGERYGYGASQRRGIKGAVERSPRRHLSISISKLE